jgi:flagellar motor switch protein FliN/FliY
MTAQTAPDTIEQASTTAMDASNIEARMPDFEDLAGKGATSGPAAPLNRLLTVNVTVTAELGRVKLPISEVLKLGVGSVIQLDRAVAEPIDIMVEGVLLARGEVVVVDDRFAIRIKQIVEPKSRA